VKNPYPIEFTQLETIAILLYLTTNGAPLDLTGATISAEVHDIELNLISPLTVQITSALAGTVLISPPVGGMTQPGRFVWDAAIVISGVRRYLPMSTCIVHPSLSRL